MTWLLTAALSESYRTTGPPVSKRSDSHTGQNRTGPWTTGLNPARMGLYLLPLFDSSEATGGSWALTPPRPVNLASQLAEPASLVNGFFLSFSSFFFQFMFVSSPSRLLPSCGTNAESTSRPCARCVRVCVCTRANRKPTTCAPRIRYLAAVRFNEAAAWQAWQAWQARQGAAGRGVAWRGVARLVLNRGSGVSRLAISDRI